MRYFRAAGRLLLGCLLALAVVGLVWEPLVSFVPEHKAFCGFVGYFSLCVILTAIMYNSKKLRPAVLRLLSRFGDEKTVVSRHKKRSKRLGKLDGFLGQIADGAPEILILPVCIGLLVAPVPFVVCVVMTIKPTRR